MFYTIVLEKTPGKRWCLQEDSSWREMGGNEFIPGDKKFIQVNDVLEYYRSDTEVLFNGSTVEVNPSSFTLGDEVWSLFPLVHRTEKPVVPTKQDLVQVIRSGSDNYHNSLVITASGKFQLINRDETDVFYNPQVAVRHETFDAGNDYIGISASEDASFIDSTYRAMLSGWNEHLESKALGIYKDYTPDFSEEELLEEAKKLVLKYDLIK